MDSSTDTRGPGAASPPAPPAPRIRRSPEHFGVLVVAFAAALGALTLALFLTPDDRGVGTHEQLGLQPCMTMERLNFPCPGCGVTTSTTMALQGDLWGSFRNQPFGLVTAGLIAAFVAWAFAGHVRGRDLYADLRGWPTGRIFAVLGALLLAAWLYKIWLVRF